MYKAIMVNPYEYFRDELIKAVDIPGYQLVPTERPINNGGVEYAIIVHKPGDEVSPNIHTNYLCDRYNGCVEDAVPEFLKMAEKVLETHPYVNTGDMMDFDKSMSKLFLGVVNAVNKQSFKERHLLYRRVHDLLVFPFYFVGPGMHFKISTNHASLWGVSPEEIFACAEKNSTAATVITDILKVLEAIRPGCLTEEYKAAAGRSPMLVVRYSTDICDIGGAAVMVLPEVRETISEIFPDGFYVIPSSISEAIIVPDVMPMDMLTDMIRQVNSDVVEPTEVLADHPYICRNGGFAMP